MADLPIVPDRFKLVVRDERSRKQMTVITRMLKRDDVSEVINACDAGREGELIFAWTFEKAGAKKPVQRLWLSSMTSKAIKEAFSSLRPASEFELLEQAARSRSEADWIVGMNATRAATIRLRSLLRRRRVAGARADADAGDHRAPRGGDPGVRARALLARGRDLRDRRRPALLRRPLPRGRAAAAEDRRGGRRRSSTPSATARARSPSSRRPSAREKAPLLYDLTSLQREANTRFGFSARRTLSAAQRLYEEHKVLTYPRTNSRFLPSDMIGEIKPIASLVGTHREYAKAAAYVTGLDVLPLGPRDQRRQGHRPPRDHPDQLRAQARQAQRRRPAHLRHGHAALPGRLPPGRRVREHAAGDDRARAHLPHARARAAGGRLARGLRRARGALGRRGRRGRQPVAAEARAGRERLGARRSPPRRRSPSRRGATPTPRCWAPWRPRASSSTTTSCARR